MNISIVIPVFNEDGNISNLSLEISRLFIDTVYEWECIWVDDASSDSSWSEIKKLESPNKGIRLRSNSGQTTAIMAGINHSNFDFIITLDGDGQNDPSDILKMIKIMESDLDIDLIQGYRVKRNDNLFTRRIPSRVANSIMRLITGHHVLDLGCSLRLFKKNLMKNLTLTGEMHRLFTLYLLDNGAKIFQTKVNHRKRLSGKSKYGLGRVLKLFIDVVLYKALKIIFINPIYTFGKFALFGYILGVGLIVAAFLLKVLSVKDYIDGTLISTAIIVTATSTLFIGLGLIAEMITRVLTQNSSYHNYIVTDKHA